MTLPDGINIDVGHYEDSRDDRGRIRVKCTRVETGRTTDPIVMANLIQGWAAAGELELARQTIEQVLKAVEPKRRGRARCRPAGITDSEAKAIGLVGTHKSFTAAAKAAGITRQAMTKRYHKGMNKVKAIVACRRNGQTLPTDRRGQIDVAAAQ
jgi:predicted DNA-binding protein (UPF0251 family)